MRGRRRIGAVVGVLIAGLVAVAGLTALRAGDARSAPEHALLMHGAGPSGSAPLTLRSWRYRADPRDAGRRRGWQDGRWRGRPVRVPYVPNARRVTGAGATRAYEGSVGWFRRTLEVPAGGTYAVRFASAHHHATVWIGGRRVRRHTGAYEPFTARAPLRAGRHVLVVRVDWRDPGRMARSGWARAWFNYGGLNRPVTLERLGPASLSALTVRTRLRPGRRARVDIGVRVRNRGAARALRVGGVLRRSGRTIELPATRVRLRAGATRVVRLTATLRRPRLWSPERPALYTLELAVPGQATLRRRVGLREVAVRGGRLRLNGRALRLVGAGLPADARGRGDAMTAADEARIVRQLRAAGANATRSQLPLSRTLLERLDAAGIFVWQHVGPWEPAAAWRSTSAGALRRARRRALLTMEEQQAHPSVLTWTLTNEAAGQGRPGQVLWVRDIARRLRRRDPGRPIAADLWGRHLPSTPGPLYDELDAVGLNDYGGWYEVPGAPAADEALVRERIARLRALFPGKALVVTEFGAAGTGRLPAEDFGGERFQARLLARRARVLAENDAVDGMLVWSLRDYALRPDFRGGSILRLRPDLRLTPGLNEKGLFDFTGRAKPALHAVRRVFTTARR